MTDDGRGSREAAPAIAVVGCGETGRRVVERFEASLANSDGPARHRDIAVVSSSDGREHVADPGAAFVVVDPADSAADELERVAAAARLAVVVPVSESAEPDGPTLERLHAASDAVLVLPGTDEAAFVDGLHRLTRLLGARSVVNLDVADLATVLHRGHLATFAHGRGDEVTAVERAIAGVPPNVRLGSGRTALVHVVGGPATSVEAVGSVVDAVRERVERDAHLIWGTTVEDDREELELELVVGGVDRARAAGEPCPRCATPLVGYSLGERSTVVCESCGFAGSAVRLR